MNYNSSRLYCTLNQLCSIGGKTSLPCKVAAAAAAAAAIAVVVVVSKAKNKDQNVMLYKSRKESAIYFFHKMAVIFSK